MSRFDRHDPNESTDLGRYICDEEEPKFDPRARPSSQLVSQELLLRINNLNIKLEPICSERFGNLAKGDPFEIEKTVQLVEVIITQFKNIRQDYKELASKSRAQDQTIRQKDELIEKLRQEKKNVEIDKETIIQKVKQAEKNHRDAIEKLNKEKEDLAKLIKQFTSKQKAFEVELKKKDQVIRAAQDSVKKGLQKATNATFKNSFDIIQKVEQGPSIYNVSANGEHEYSRLARNAKDDTLAKLAEENKNLRKALICMNNEINEVISLKRATLQQKKGYDGQYDSYFELNKFKDQAFHLPDEYRQDKINKTFDNIEKLKQVIKIGSESQNRFEDSKENCVNGIKSIIKKYKQVVESQDALINKVIVKSKELKASQASSLENRLSKLPDSNDVERARRFIDENTQFLEAKNLELEKTRRHLQHLFKRGEEHTREMIKSKQAMEQEALEMRRSIEVLPAMIYEELNKIEN